MSAPQVVVHRDPALLAQSVADRFISRIAEVQASTGVAHVVLTGGGMGTAVLAAVAASRGRDAIDWAHVHVWWGDERFVAAGNAERNDGAARAALLDAVPIDPGHVHAMPTIDGPDGNDPEAAAARYARELSAASGPSDRTEVPAFDVVLLGVGEDGHVASLFPGLPAVFDLRPVVGVRGAPKPPPIRISLTFTALNAAREIWLVTAGAGKAAAVKLALGGAGRVEIPAAGVHGRQRTLWLLDEAAAAQLPRGLSRLASP